MTFLFDQFCINKSEIVPVSLHSQKSFRQIQSFVEKSSCLEIVHVADCEQKNRAPVFLFFHMYLQVTSFTALFCGRIMVCKKKHTPQFAPNQNWSQRSSILWERLMVPCDMRRRWNTFKMIKYHRQWLQKVCGKKFWPKAFRAIPTSVNYLQLFVCLHPP